MLKKNSDNYLISGFVFTVLFGVILLSGIASAGINDQTAQPDNKLAQSIIFPKIDRRPVLSVLSDMSDNRGILASIPNYDPNNSDTFQVDLRSYDLSAFDLNSSLYDLLYSSFNTQTTWPVSEKMPQEFDYEQIMELGKNPGLGVRDLHKRGITGSNVGIAIIDQPLLTEHKEYAGQLRLYEEINVNAGTEAQMHGAAVASIAVGQTVGLAPRADLYYIGIFAHDLVGPSYEQNLSYYAQGIMRILEVNKQLPEDRKIRVISISKGFNKIRTGYDDVMAACEQAKAEGMLIVCSNIEDIHDGLNLGGMGRYPTTDPDMFESYAPGIFWAQWFYSNPSVRSTNDLLVPMDSRTTASPCGNDMYTWYSTAGVSWAIPYLAGVYSLAAQVEPSITPEKFQSLAMATGRIIEIKHNDEIIPLGTIIDPVALIDALSLQ